MKNWKTGIQVKHCRYINPIFGEDDNFSSFQGSGAGKSANFEGKTNFWKFCVLSTGTVLERESASDQFRYRKPSRRQTHMDNYSAVNIPVLDIEDPLSR